jgi:glycosyltransferase involved in cell wall biosynthesis
MMTPPSVSVLHVFAPGPAGGLEAVVSALARGARDGGIVARVAGIELGPPAERAPLLRALQAAQVEYHAVSVTGRSYREERLGVAAICRRVRPDVVHTHGYRADVVDAPAAQALGIPVATTVHGFTGGGWKNRAYEWLQRRRFRRFDAVIAVSEPLVTRLARSGVPRQRLHYIQNAWSPVDSPVARSEARQALGVPADGFRAGWVGRLSREKGPDLLLTALAELHEERVAASVLGDGPERESLTRSIARLDLGPGVVLHGTIPNAGRLFRAFDVLVVSSRTEGTPIVVFEAMAAGVPIVATAVGGVPNVIGAGEALIVEPDARALAAAIRSVKEDPGGAARRAQAAGARLVRQFGVSPWIGRYREVYEEIARR